MKEIYWTIPAKTNLQKIYDYLSEIAVQIADKQIDRILFKVELLENYSEIGTKEPLLLHKKNIYRYLIQDNYKIIYSVTAKRVIIHMVFDTRQNPQKIRQLAN